MKSDCYLVMVARCPELGQGKRRLAADIGDGAAHRFQRVALERLLRRLGGDPRWRLCLAVTPDTQKHVRGVWRVVGQGQGDLGARMAHISRILPDGPLVFIGSDAPEVTREDVSAAFEALSNCDSAIGPAPDGGYWLIGFSESQRPSLPFARVRWSTQHTREDTLRNLTDKRVAMLREQEDVDDGPTYRRWLRKNIMRADI
jgi:uncharacterized protein